ncbi:BNR repeat-like domain protein [compost metagenome]
MAYLRDSGDAPNRVHYSESADQGQSWIPSVKTGIPNTASVEILVLQNGLWIFVGNDLNGTRTRLSLYVSDDEGITWKWKHLLEDQEKGGYSYPALIQSADGRIHITYSYHPESHKKTIKHVQLKPENLVRSVDN